jgi:hypothetical protein
MPTYAALKQAAITPTTAIDPEKIQPGNILFAVYNFACGPDSQRFPIGADVYCVSPDQPGTVTVHPLAGPVKDFVVPQSPGGQRFDFYINSALVQDHMGTGRPDTTRLVLRSGYSVDVPVSGDAFRVYYQGAYRMPRDMSPYRATASPHSRAAAPAAAPTG